MSSHDLARDSPPTTGSTCTVPGGLRSLGGRSSYCHCTHQLVSIPGGRANQGNERGMEYPEAEALAPVVRLAPIGQSPPKVAPRARKSIVALREACRTSTSSTPQTYSKPHCAPAILLRLCSAAPSAGSSLWSLVLVVCGCLDYALDVTDSPQRHHATRRQTLLCRHLESPKG